jgi:hypothetical protein
LFVEKAEYGYSEFTEAGTVYFAEGNIWYLSEQGCIDDTIKKWFWLLKSNSCSPGASKPSCPLRPVPTWVRDLLPNPPYTMAVEYE